MQVCKIDKKTLKGLAIPSIDILAQVCYNVSTVRNGKHPKDRKEVNAMMKHEFEAIAKIEVTDKMYEMLEKMYEATDLSKHDFVKMLDLSAIKVEKEIDVVTVEVDRFPNGTILHYEAELVDTDISTGKPVVRRLTENRAWAHTSATYRECNCIVR